MRGHRWRAAAVPPCAAVTGGPQVVQVSAEHPYEVLIGHRLQDQLLTLLGEGVRKAAVVHPPTMIDAGRTLDRRPASLR